MNLKLEVEYLDEHAIITVHGDIDVYTAPDLYSELQRLIDAGSRHLAVNLTDCQYFDSDGVKALIRAYRSMGTDTPIYIIGATQLVAKVFRLTGLEHLFPQIPSAESLPPVEP